MPVTRTFPLSLRGLSWRDGWRHVLNIGESFFHKQKLIIKYDETLALVESSCLVLCFLCSPPGVAWEVRKTLSPSKSGAMSSRRAAGGVVRNLEAGLTWADRVRGRRAAVEGGAREGEEGGKVRKEKEMETSEIEKLSKDRESTGSVLGKERDDDSCTAETRGNKQVKTSEERETQAGKEDGTDVSDSGALCAHQTVCDYREVGTSC